MEKILMMSHKYALRSAPRLQPCICPRVAQYSLIGGWSNVRAHPDSIIKFVVGGIGRTTSVHPSAEQSSHLLCCL